MNQFAPGLLTGFICFSLGISSALSAETSVKLRLMAEGFVSPTVLVPLDEGAGLSVVADQAGIARVMEKDGTLREEPFLDVTDRLTKLNEAAFDERGLLGLALHPKFRENLKFYAFYSAKKRASAPADWDHTSRLSEFKLRDAKSWVADPSSERVLLEIDKPYFNHNGGCILFGPDGYLYVSVGDGGNMNDQGRGHSATGNGQDLSTLLGKILRLDVDHGQPYTIPQDNPFARAGGRPEIFAYGFRNPWRVSFDRGGGHGLFAGDIGQNLYEEVDFVVKGGNYGWFIREGRHCFDPANAKAVPTNCASQAVDGKAFIDPILEYKNSNGFRNDPDAGGISVIGGYIYRGGAIPSLVGKYVFGDWSRNWAVADSAIYVATKTTAKDSDPWTRVPIKIALEDGSKWKAYITGFGEDAQGELYLFTNASNTLAGKTGKVYKLVGIE